jgi:hypothetical protein
MSSAFNRASGSIFLALCDIANQKSYTAVNDADSRNREHLTLFLHWLSLSRIEQVHDMLPYLRTFAGVNDTAISRKSARAYFQTLVPSDATPAARRLFLTIVEGVFMIYLQNRPQDERL